MCWEVVILEESVKRMVKKCFSNNEECFHSLDLFSNEFNG